MIATQRLDLVALAPEDAEEMVAVLSDEQLYAFTGGERVLRRMRHSRNPDSAARTD